MKKTPHPSLLSRRRLLTSASTFLLLSTTPLLRAQTEQGKLPWAPNSGSPPTPVTDGPWQFFTAEEAAFIEAAVDRLIPADDLGPGGREAGCAVFIDRQLAGDYGRSAGYYLKPPFKQGTATQGWQSPDTPNVRYRKALSKLLPYIKQTYGGKSMADLTPQQQDDLLAQLEAGKINLGEVSSAEFFKFFLNDTQTGFFADPIYGGNRDMVGWKLVGFPGARYDYRDWIDRHNEPYPLPPVSIQGRADWNIKE